jgi:hypothetical protein
MDAFWEWYDNVSLPLSYNEWKVGYGLLNDAFDTGECDHDQYFEFVRFFEEN